MHVDRTHRKDIMKRSLSFHLLVAAPALALAAAAASFATPSFAQQPPAPAPPAAQAPAPGATPGATPSVADVVGSVQAFYNRTTSFRSEFDQEYWVKLHNVRKTSHGQVTFAKPGKMNWVYADPQGNRVVSDGNMLRVYEAANRQMYEQKVDKSQYPAALSFLTGQGSLTGSFDFELFDGKQFSFPGGWVLVGSPKTPTPAYQKVLFYVDQSTSQVRRVMVIDGQGNRNRFDFKNPRVNEPVSNQEFVFAPPPGTSVVHP
jgi:outer membrane lipoprotein carrier protein